MTCAWQCEIDPFCWRVLERHWPGVTRYEDVREIVGHECEAVGLLCGGFPCQDVSVAGNRAGLAGERSGLFFEFMRVVAEIAPAWVLIENVPGLLSSNGGRDMGAVIGTLADLGYWWAYRVLDSQYFGVAQRRRRVYIVANSASPAGPIEVLFEPCSCERRTAPSREAGQVAATISASGAGTRSTGGRAAEHDFYVTQALTGTYANGGADDNKAQAGFMVPVDVSANQRGKGVRRLTPLECERLQGFPDNWTAVDGEDTPDTPRYRALGNAVTVPVAEWIGRRILACAGG